MRWICSPNLILLNHHPKISWRRPGLYLELSTRIEIPFMVITMISVFPRASEKSFNLPLTFHMTMPSWSCATSHYLAQSALPSPQSESLQTRRSVLNKLSYKINNRASKSIFQTLWKWRKYVIDPLACRTSLDDFSGCPFEENTLSLLVLRNILYSSDSISSSLNVEPNTYPDCAWARLTPEPN